MIEIVIYHLASNLKSGDIFVGTSRFPESEQQVPERTKNSRKKAANSEQNEINSNGNKRENYQTRKFLKRYGMNKRRTKNRHTNGTFPVSSHSFWNAAFP